MAKQVLIVDDEKDVTTVLSKRFQSKGFEVAVAHDGRSALRHVGDHHVDLIVLDIMMPGMDGTEVAAELKEDPGTRDIPIIFLSAIASRRDTAGTRVGTPAGGPNVIFAKPYNSEELLRKAAELVAR